MRDLIVRAPRTPRRLHWHCGTFAASWGTSFPRSAISAVGGNRTFSTESVKKRHCRVIGTCPLHRKNRTSQILRVRALRGSSRRPAWPSILDHFPPSEGLLYRGNVFVLVIVWMLFDGSSSPCGPAAVRRTRCLF